MSISSNDTVNISIILQTKNYDKIITQLKNISSKDEITQLLLDLFSSSLFSQDLKLFDFFVEDYEILTLEQKEVLKTYIYDKNIHPYCRAIISQFLWEVDSKHSEFMKIAYDSFIRAIDYCYFNKRRNYYILQHCLIIYISFKKILETSPNIHDKILEFLSFHHEENSYKILKIAYNQNIISLEETLKEIQNYLENIEDLYGMYEVIGEYIGLLKELMRKEKYKVDQLINIKKIKLMQIESMDITAASFLEKKLIHEYIHLKNSEIQLLKEYDDKGTLTKRKEILRELNVLNKEIANNIPVHEDSIDVKKEIKELYEHLDNIDNKTDALNALLILPFLNKEASFENCQTFIAECKTLYSQQEIYDVNGKVIFRHPRFGSGKDNSSLESSIFMKSCHDFADYITQVHISRILEYIKNKFEYQEDDIKRIIYQSEFMPKDRRKLYLKGIWAGFNEDYYTALNILIPQFENSIREIAIIYGDYPYKIDENGIESSLSLENMVALPKIQELFDDNLLLTIRYLFTDNLGLNARNYLAHGLFEDGFFESYEAIYTWWFIFKMCYIFNDGVTIYTMMRKTKFL